jgi:hypothetical protein
MVATRQNKSRLRTTTVIVDGDMEEISFGGVPDIVPEI